MSAASGELPRRAPERRAKALRVAHHRRWWAGYLAALPSLWRPHQLDRRLRTHRGFRRWWRRVERRGTYQPGMLITLRRVRLRVLGRIGLTFQRRKVSSHLVDELADRVLSEVL